MLAVLLSSWKFQDSLPCSTSLIKAVLDKTKEHKFTISFRVEFQLLLKVSGDGSVCKESKNASIKSKRF